MEEKEKSLNKRQAWFNAPKKHLACLLYACFYTVCLYHNRSGITLPFFVGGTLFFFGFYFKRSGSTAAAKNRFLMTAMMLLGISGCTTDSDVLVCLDKLLGVLLFGVWLLQMAAGESNTVQWRVLRWCREVCSALLGSLGYILTPFSEALAYQKAHQKATVDAQALEKRNRIIRAVVIGVTISLPFLFIVGVLLLCADAVFYEMFCDALLWLMDWHIPAWLRNGAFIRIGLCIVCVFAYSYGIVTWGRRRQEKTEAAPEEKERFDTYIGITAAVLVTLLYLLFCGVQILGLFLGKLQLPTGYTYAEYARSGFFPLLFVCLLNICLVPACHSIFHTSKALNLLLTVICCCTYIMIASSAYRMLLYIDSYSMTFLRLAVLWTLAVMAILTGGMIYDIYHEAFRLPRFLLVVATCGYLSFALVHPDYWIARYNISALQQDKPADTYYLYTGLSADAAPAIASINESGEYDALKQAYFQRIEEKNSGQTWRSWNLSRAIAAAYK